MRRRYIDRLPTWVVLQIAQLGGLLCAGVILVVPMVQNWSNSLDEETSTGSRSRGKVYITEYHSKYYPGCTIKELSKTVLTCKNVRFVDGFGARPTE